MYKYEFPQAAKVLNNLIPKWKKILKDDELEQNTIDFYKTNIREGLELKERFDNFETLVIAEPLSFIIDCKTKRSYVMNVNTSKCIWLSYQMLRQMLLNYGYSFKGMDEIKKAIKKFFRCEPYNKLEEIYTLIRRRYPRREIELTFTQLDVFLYWRCDDENKNSEESN